MHGLGRWLVYSRPRAWVGQRFELPHLLKDVKLPSDAWCLDLATGLGWATAGIAQTTPSARIVSVDYDFDVLPRAREYLHSQRSGANATLCRADGKRLPFRDGSFELVVCLYGLHHFRGYLDALKEIARVLKSTGTFALIDPIRNADKPPGGHQGTEVPTQAELRHMLDEAGFEVTRSRVSFGAMRVVTRRRVGTHDEAIRHTRKVAPIEYAGVLFRNREVFLLNYAADFRRFDLLLSELQEIWLRVARERDRQGGSHVSLLLPSAILIRHCVLAFQQLISYQSFLTWLAFRPGLEALLVVGKWVDDPKNAKIWMERDADRALYSETFSGKGLTSVSLPRSADFRAVLSRLNDQFVHPNPKFAYRDSNLRAVSDETLVLTTSFFDQSAELHEAHLLAYLNLLNQIVTSCDQLVERICDSPRSSLLIPPLWPISQHDAERATSLAIRNPVAKTIMEQLGLWSFKS